jgi:hypothetical protein
MQAHLASTENPTLASRLQQHDRAEGATLQVRIVGSTGCRLNVSQTACIAFVRLAAVNSNPAVSWWWSLAAQLHKAQAAALRIAACFGVCVRGHGLEHVRQHASKILLARLIPATAIVQAWC